MKIALLIIIDFFCQALASVFPSQFQNDDIFQQLLVFLKNKNQEIGKTLRSQTVDLCNLSRVLMFSKRFSSKIVFTFSCFCWIYASNF